MDKLVSIDYAVGMVSSGDTVAFGGNVLYRSPVQVAARMALSGIKNITVVKTAIALEADILCGAGCASAVMAGYVGYEAQFGLCQFYRKAVESGAVTAREHACYSVITALRAAAQGVPFLPIRGMLGSDLIEAVGFKMVRDPYTGEVLCAVQAVAPDVAFLHVQRADRFGNAEVEGPLYEDLIIARSAKCLILTCEELVGDDYFGPGRKAALPEILVTGIVHLPGCAAPGECQGHYSLDEDKLAAFKALKTQEQLFTYLQKEAIG